MKQKIKKFEAKPPAPTPLLSREKVLEIVGVTYPTLWTWIKNGHFPPGRLLGPKEGVRGSRISWIESEVSDWISSRPPRWPKGSKRVAS